MKSKNWLHRCLKAQKLQQQEFVDFPSSLLSFSNFIGSKFSQSLSLLFNFLNENISLINEWPMNQLPHS